MPTTCRAHACRFGRRKMLFTSPRSKVRFPWLVKSSIVGVADAAHQDGIIMCMYPICAGTPCKPLNFAFLQPKPHRKTYPAQELCRELLVPPGETQNYEDEVDSAINFNSLASIIFMTIIFLSHQVYCVRSLPQCRYAPRQAECSF